MGRECILHYSTLRRNCVFSHDELVCKMALEADSLSLTVALAAYRDMRTMLHDERKLRKGLLDWVSYYTYYIRINFGLSSIVRVIKITVINNNYNLSIRSTFPSLSSMKSSSHIHAYHCDMVVFTN